MNTARTLQRTSSNLFNFQIPHRRCILQKLKLNNTSGIQESKCVQKFLPASFCAIVQNKCFTEQIYIKNIISRQFMLHKQT